MDKENLKETLLNYVSIAKSTISNFLSAHIKLVILILILIVGIIVGNFVLTSMEAEKIANATEVHVNLIEGQSYTFEQPITSCDLDVSLAEFLDVSIDEQKMYGLSNYTEGEITFYGKLEDGTYVKYIVLVTTLDAELEQTVSVARGSTYNIRDWDASYTACWASSDEQVATVDQEGNVTGLDLGECDITAKITEELTVTYHVSVVDVALSPANPYLYIGDSLTYTILGYEPAADEKLLIESDNLEVATVRGMKARAIAEGTATISLTVNGKTYTSNLTVLGTPSVEDVTVTVDCEAELIAKNIPNWADCEEIKIAAENIASYKDGKIQAKALGTTQLTGKIKGHEFSCKITVTGAALVPDPNAVYDTNFTKYDVYEGLAKYSIKENETLKIYFTNANSNVPTTKTNDNNFRIFDTTNEYIEIIGTNPGVGLLAVDFDDNRLYAEIHVQHTNSTVTQRQWEVELKTFTDTLKDNGDWIYSDEVHGAYIDARTDLTRKINGISMINYTLQELDIFKIENFLTIGEDGKVTGSEETMQIVDKYAETMESTEEKKLDANNLQKGDIVIWKDGNVSVFMGKNNGNTLTWYEVNEDLVEPDGFFKRFYNEDNKDKMEMVQIIRLHYTL